MRNMESVRAEDGCRRKGGRKANAQGWIGKGRNTTHMVRLHGRVELGDLCAKAQAALLWSKSKSARTEPSPKAAHGCKATDRLGVVEPHVQERVHRRRRRQLQQVLDRHTLYNRRCAIQ